jgi:MFS family permease
MPAVRSPPGYHGPMLEEEPAVTGAGPEPIRVNTSAGPAASATTPRHPSLWHHADYVRLWTAATISLMGSQVSQIAIPFVAAVLLSASPFEVAILGAVDMLPFLLLTLPAGAILDRVRRRPVLVLGDLGRAVALASIPFAYAFGTLTIWQLYVVGFVTGTLTVLFDVADQSYLPALVEPEDLVEANSRLQVSGSGAQIAGPGLAGWLLGFVGNAASPFAILIDAISFLFSGALIATIRRHEPKPERRRDADGRDRHLVSEMRDGLAYVLGHRSLRMIAGSTATSNLGSSMAFAVFPVFAYVELGLNPGVIGTAFGLGGFGFLAGALLSGRISKAIGVGRAIISAQVVGGLATLPLALLPSDQLVAGVMLFGGAFLVGFAQVVYNIGQLSYRQAITPLDMQGRMNATMRFLVWGIMPIGSLAGGILASFVPLRMTILAGALVAVGAFLWVLLSPVRSLREIPTGTADRGVAAPD